MSLRLMIAIAALLLPATAWADDSPVPLDAPPAVPTTGPIPRYEVDTFGSAPQERPNAREDAINDALRRAVEQAGGIKIESGSASRDMALVSDYIISESCGIIESYTVIAENPDQNGMYYVRLKAAVIQSKADIDRRIAAFEALMHQVGRPRMLLVGSVDGRPFDGWVTRALQDTLDLRGFYVVSLDNLDQRRLEDMQRKTQVDRDAALAAIINTEVKADYYVIITTQLREDAPVLNDISKTTLFPIGATASIEVVQRDTSRIMASKTVEEPIHNFLEQVTGRRKATIAAADAALKQAITRIAQHWLHDYNGRHAIGGDIEIVLDRFPVQRTLHLAESLRKVRDVQRVDIDNMDENGRSSLRITTKVSAADVVMMLTQVDPSLTGIKTTKNQIEIGEAIVPTNAAPTPVGQKVEKFALSMLLKICFFVSATLIALLGLIMYLRRKLMY